VLCSRSKSILVVNKEEDLYKKLVRDGYESKDVIDSYSTVGLYKPERVLIQQFLPKEGNILDIGCGAGRTTIPLSQLGYSVCGIDLSPNMIEAAREQATKYGLKIDFYDMNARNLAFSDEYFDGALFSFNGFDHVPGYSEKIEVFREVSRVLKPGAPFIFSVHRIWCPYHLRNLLVSGLKTSFGNLFGSAKSDKTWGDFDDNLGYMSFMKLKRWEQAIKDSGFELLFRQSRFQLAFGGSLKNLQKALDGNFMYYVVSKPNRI